MQKTGWECKLFQENPEDCWTEKTQAFARYKCKFAFENFLSIIHETVVLWESYSYSFCMCFRQDIYTSVITTRTWSKAYEAKESERNLMTNTIHPTWVVHSVEYKCTQNQSIFWRFSRLSVMHLQNSLRITQFCSTMNKYLRYQDVQYIFLMIVHYSCLLCLVLYVRHMFYNSSFILTFFRSTSVLSKSTLFVDINAIISFKPDQDWTKHSLLR